MDPDHIIGLLGDVDDQVTQATFVTGLMPVIRGMESYFKCNNTERQTWIQTFSTDMLVEVLNSPRLSIRVTDRLKAFRQGIISAQ